MNGGGARLGFGDPALQTAPTDRPDVTAAVHAAACDAPVYRVTVEVVHLLCPPGIPSAPSPGMGSGQAISSSFIPLLHTLPMVVSPVGSHPDGHVCETRELPLDGLGTGR